MSHHSIEPAWRATTWVVLTALLLVFGVGLGSHFHLVVCTGDCCVHAAANPAATPRDTCGSCCCREHSCAKSAAREKDPGRGSHRGTCKPGCCVDLVIDVELAPAPRAVTEDVPNAYGIETVQAQGIMPTRSWPQWQWPHDTGPPHTDRRTALLASTVLRL